MTGLYVITRPRPGGPGALAEAVDQALAGGAVMVQYRDKSADEVRRERETEAILEACRGRGAPLVINDDLELARKVGADGVHLGREDATVQDARHALGPRAIVGVSCYNELARAQAAERAGASYVAFGSFFPSPTKPGAVRASPDLLSEAQERVSLPVCAIGGITPANGGKLVEAGADLLAVVSGVFEAHDIRNSARNYAGLFRQPSRPIHER